MTNRNLSRTMSALREVRGQPKPKAWTLPTMETHGRAATEHEEQCDYVRWHRQTYGDSARIFAIPNGEKRSKRDGLRLKVEGVSAGVPDLFVPAWTTWIEMKVKGGCVSKEQEDWHGYLRSIGHTVILAYGSADAQRQILEARHASA